VDEAVTQIDGGTVTEANLSMEHGAGVMEERPFAIPSKKLVMWLFIISDACTFGAMLFAYGYVRNAAPDWPHHFETASIINVAIMTFILVTSSLTMLIGTRAAHAGDKAGAIRFTFITVALGLVFAALHLREWASMIHEGATLFQNPWGAPLFGASFFGITGLHLAHVISGAIALTVVALGYKRGRYNADDIEIWSLYWHFVDLVWMFVVPMVYLLNVAQ
jgi:cytochrome c oxidase subunit 3